MKARAWTTGGVYGPHWPWLFVLYVALAAICGHLSWSRVVIAEGRTWTNQTSIDSVVSGLSDNPQGTARWALVRSRMLVPGLIVKAREYFGIPYRVTHDASRLLFIYLSLLFLHWHFRAWFTPLESLVGTVIVIASITITFNGFYPIVTDFPELAGVTACAGLLARRKWSWLLAALAITTLNRENAVIMVPTTFCVLYQDLKRLGQTLLPTAMAAATWGLAFILARHLAGVTGDWIQKPEGSMRGAGLFPELIGVFIDTWPRRLESVMSLVHNPHPYNANWSPFLVLNVFWILPLVYWRSVPTFFRRLYVGGLIGILPIFISAGVMNEAGRHMIPLYPLLMPAGLSVLYRRVVPASPPIYAEALEGL